jgi:hypothetical protein
VGVKVSGHGVWPEAIGLIGLFDMKGIAIRFGINRHGFYAHFGTGPNYADRDFPSISD